MGAEEKFKIEIWKWVILKSLGLDTKTSGKPEISIVSSDHHEQHSVKFSTQTNMFLIHFSASKWKHNLKLIFFKKVPIFKSRFLSYGNSDQAELGADNLNFLKGYLHFFFNFFWRPPPPRPTFFKISVDLLIYTVF